MSRTSYIKRAKILRGRRFHTMSISLNTVKSNYIPGGSSASKYCSGPLLRWRLTADHEDTGTKSCARREHKLACAIMSNYKKTKKDHNRVWCL